MEYVRYGVEMNRREYGKGTTTTMVLFHLQGGHYCFISIISVRGTGSKDRPFSLLLTSIIGALL